MVAERETRAPRDRPPWLRLGAALLGAAALALAGCADADTLGGAAPTEVQVGSPPTWDNGIGDLMQLKCGVCHQVPAGPLSPSGTPQAFDLNFHVTSPDGTPGAQSATVLNAIGAGILRGAAGGARQMPLDYATPLVGGERQALESWAGAGGP